MTFSPCLPHFHPASVFQYRGAFLDEKQDQIGVVVKYTVFIVSWVGRAMSCFLSVHICLGTSGECQPFNTEQSSHHSFSCVTRLNSSQPAKTEKTQIFHIKITQQIDFNYGWSETKCFIRCGCASRWEAAAWWKGLKRRLVSRCGRVCGQSVAGPV